jgi:hypothetical protein
VPSPLLRAAAPAAALVACLAVQGGGAPSLAGAARPAPAAPARPAALTRATPARLLLLNGDQAVVGLTQGGPVAAAVSSGPGTNLARSLLKARLGGHSFLIPMAALPYLGHGLDASLFDVATLQRAEAGQAGGRLPVTLRFRGRLHTVPGVTVTHTGAGVARGYLTASSAPAFGAALARQLMADHGKGSYGSDGMFAGALSISLPGAGTAPARPQFPMHVLTVKGTNLAGKPDTGDVVDVINVNDIAAFGAFLDSENAFFHGTAKYSVPDGTYWAIGTFFTGNGFRIDVLPQFAVRGTTTVRVNEKAATSKVSFVTPRRATLQDQNLTVVRQSGNSVASFGYEAGNGTLWINPVSRRPSDGSLHAFTEGLLSSPASAKPAYDYTLNFAGPAGTIPPQRHVARPRDLATVSERYYQDVSSTGGWITLGGTRYQISTSFIGGLVPSIRLPARQIQYISAGPGMLWQTQYWAYNNSANGGQFESFRTLPAGGRVAEAWNRYPLHPGVNRAFPHTSFFQQVPSAVRAGDTLILDLTPFSDNHRAHLSSSGFGGAIFGGGPKLTGSYALYENGRKIAAGNAVKAAGGAADLFLQAKLGHQPSRIKFSMKASRAGQQFPLSPASTDVWAWRSAPDPKATVTGPWVCGFGVRGFDRHCVVQRLLTLNYNVAGLALTGTTPGGRQVLHLTVGHLQQAAAVKVTHAWAQVSFNGGKTWHPVRVARTGRATLRATFRAPAHSQVSLRVGVHGSGETSLTETVFHAYRTAA